MVEEINVEEMSDEQLEAVEEQIKQRKQRFNWTGTNGIYRDARRLPLEVHKDESLSGGEAKREALKERMEAFIEERLS